MVRLLTYLRVLISDSASSARFLPLHSQLGCELDRSTNMLPEFEIILSYLQMHADILRQDYGDILDEETLQSMDKFIDAATNLCHKVHKVLTKGIAQQRSIQRV